MIQRYHQLSDSIRWLLCVPLSVAITGTVSVMVGALLINTFAFSGLIMAVAETVVSHLTLIGALHLTVPKGRPVVARIGMRVIAVMSVYFGLCALLGHHDAWRDATADLLASGEELLTLLVLWICHRTHHPRFWPKLQITGITP